MFEQHTQHLRLPVQIYALLRCKSIADNQLQLKAVLLLKISIDQESLDFNWEHKIYYLFCVKQLSSNFQPQYRGKTKQLRGLEQAEVAYK